MAWFSGKVSLGNFPDLAGAVNKLQESVKNIEKNFDNALGFEEKSDEATDSSNEASSLWPSATGRVMAFMGQKSDESVAVLSGETDNSQNPSKVEEDKGLEADRSVHLGNEQSIPREQNEVVNAEKDEMHPKTDEGTDTITSSPSEVDLQSKEKSLEPPPEATIQNLELSNSSDDPPPKEIPEVELAQNIESVEAKSEVVGDEEVGGPTFKGDESNNDIDVHGKSEEQEIQTHETVEESSPVKADLSNDSYTEEGDKSSGLHSSTAETENAKEASFPSTLPSGMVLEPVSAKVETQTNDGELDRSQGSSSVKLVSVPQEIILELEKTKKEMKMIEAALQGAARQAQAKADEIERMMNENEQLKVVIEDLKRKSNEAEMESLREEYHQRVATMERKVYALTKERDTLRREQNRKSDAAALLKEKDEIITAVMAEGEELSKKQAAQESLMRKLRAQIRELEEDKKGLSTKLQVEESKVESIKRDKTATENLLQETIERNLAELTAQKEYYTSALAEAKEAVALAEARANDEARTELESRLREGEERETMLVQTLEELRQTLSRNEQQVVFREDMLRKDIEDLQKRYQESERRCEELITQVPESTRPLLRQIEAMQDTTARRAEAWAAVERSLDTRLQEAESRAASAEERERSVNERLSQTLSRINVLEAQISCLRAEQTQLSRSLEKERQRASENRQEYLAAKEEADTQEGRVTQLEEEIRELRRKHKQDLHDALVHRELLEQELEREKATRLDLERTARSHSTIASEQAPLSRKNSIKETEILPRKFSSAISLGSMEESYFLQASLDSSDSFSERRNSGEVTMSPYYMKSMTPSAFEATLRQKEGELASYMSRLTSLESIRDSLAEELVKMTAQCEKLQAEAAILPGVRAELDALRRRHSAALELMGERDEELEELRADIVDLKEMYREQVNLLVNKVQVLSQSMSNS